MKRFAIVCSLGAALSLVHGAARAADGGATATLQTIALPTPAACTFRTAQWWQTTRLELADGIPYADVIGTQDVELLVPVAAAPVPFGVKVTVGKIELVGLASEATFPVRASRAFVMGEVFLPTPATKFRWTDANAGELGVELRLPAATAKVVKGVERLHARRPCGDFTIQAITPFEALAGVGGRGLGEKGRLKPPTPVPIAAAPGGAPLARLVPSRSVSEAMVVMERRPGWTRIGVEFTDLAVVGWAPAASVLPPPNKVEDSDALGGLGLSGSGSTLTKAITCDHDVRLVAQAGKLRRIVGTLRAGAHMEVAPADAGFARVTLDEVKPANGAKLLVRRAELDGCGAAPNGERDRPHRRRE